MCAPSLGRAAFCASDHGSFCIKVRNATHGARARVLIKRRLERVVAQTNRAASRSRSSIRRWARPHPPAGLSCNPGCLRRDGAQPHPPTHQGKHRCASSTWSKGRPSADHDRGQAALRPAPHGRSVTQHSHRLPGARRHPEPHPLALPARRWIAQGTRATAPRQVMTYVAFRTFMQKDPTCWEHETFPFMAANGKVGSLGPAEARARGALRRICQ